MSIKSILAVFGGQPHELNALTSALTLARAGRAFVRVLHIAQPPVLPETLGIGSYAVSAGIDSHIVDQLEDDARYLSDQAAAYVASASSREVVPLLQGDSIGAKGQAFAVLRVVTGDPQTCLLREANMADLVVSGYDNRPGGDFKGIVTTLFGADRPILLLPRTSDDPMGLQGFPRTVAFAWDGSHAAAEALRGAVPMMLHAEKVYLVRVSTQGAPTDAVTEADLFAYLHSHCIAPQLIHAPRNGQPIGDVLLATCARLEADLLAMGGYGHGHLSEMLLGGVTDYVLKHARLPLLLAR